MATMNALTRLRSAQQVAEMRGVAVPGAKPARAPDAVGV
jgi:hypothetical protein